MATILIVEDDISLRENLEEIFKFKGYTVISENNGEDGFQTALLKEPDLIISDIMMSKMDGYSLLQSVRQNNTIAKTPVILLTAKTLTDSKIKGLEYGADDYITKPFNIKELSARVVNLLTMRKLLKAENFYDSNEVQTTSTKDIFLSKLFALFKDKMENSYFAIEDVVQEMGLSKSTIQRRVKSSTSKTFNQLLREFRLEEAKQILEQGGGNISEVAFAVGFNSVSYFSYSFKNYYGYSPTEITLK